MIKPTSQISLDLFRIGYLQLYNVFQIITAKSKRKSIKQFDRIKIIDFSCTNRNPHAKQPTLLCKRIMTGLAKSIRFIEFDTRFPLIILPFFDAMEQLNN